MALFRCLVSVAKNSWCGQPVWGWRRGRRRRQRGLRRRRRRWRRCRWRRRTSTSHPQGGRRRRWGRDSWRGQPLGWWRQGWRRRRQRRQRRRRRCSAFSKGCRSFVRRAGVAGGREVQANGREGGGGRERSRWCWGGCRKGLRRLTARRGGAQLAEYFQRNTCVQLEGRRQLGADGGKCGESATCVARGRRLQARIGTVCLPACRGTASKRFEQVRQETCRFAWSHSGLDVGAQEEQGKKVEEAETPPYVAAPAPSPTRD